MIIKIYKKVKIVQNLKSMKLVLKKKNLNYNYNLKKNLSKIKLLLMSAYKIMRIIY